MLDEKDLVRHVKSSTAAYTLLGCSALILALCYFLPGLYRTPYNQQRVDVVVIFGLSVGIFMGMVALFKLYDAQPLPEEAISAPLPPDLYQSQAWRKSTSLRYLEELKKDLAKAEERLLSSYEKALEGYNTLRQSSGRFEYGERKLMITYYAAMLLPEKKDITELVERIDRMFAGDVSFEVGSLNESVARAKRKRQEYERQLKDTQEKCTIKHRDDDEVRECDNRRQSLQTKLHGYIYNIDQEVIGYEAQIQELKEFDFKRLYRELGLPGPPGLINVDTSHIKDIKDKAGLLQNIPDVGPRQQAGPKRPKEEEEIDRIVAAIDNIEGLKKAWTAKKKDTPPDQHALIDRLFRKAIDARLDKL